MRTRTRPLIGLTAWLRHLPTTLGPKTPLHTASRWYVESVERAGGIPLIIPAVAPELAPEILDVLDGLIVTGGEDVDPSRYGQERHPRTQTPDAQRDAFEMAALAEAEERRLPTFCICRGLQVLNVARGGTLIQDVPDQVEGAAIHARPDAFFETVHPVRVAEGSRLCAILDGREVVDVNTSHHQAVDEVGRGLRAVAWAPEGFVEAVEDERDDRFLLAVQWHPEGLSETHAEHLAPFRALVEAAGRRTGGGLGEARSASGEAPDKAGPSADTAFGGAGRREAGPPIKVG